jgi:single-strand DNA-binding protein
MSDIAILTITGRVTSDGEIAYTSNGTPMLKFSVACNRWKGGGQKTSFYDCVMWGKIAESKQQFTNKGQHVQVSGNLDIDEFEGQYGKVKKPTLTALALEPSPGGGSGNGNSGGYSNGGGYSQPRGNSGGYSSNKPMGEPKKDYSNDPFYDDDIPF